MAQPARLPAVGVWSRELGQGGMPLERHTDFIQAVEILGYDMVWISESFGREVFTHAAVTLANSGLRVGTGIANIWGRDAMAMSNAAKTLGEAYPGRFVLGVGVSHDRLVETRTHEYRSPVTALERYLRDMDEAPYTGPVAPVPVPRLVGALGPRALRVAADFADGAHPYLVTPEHTASARSILGGGAILAPEQSVVLSDDSREARAAARRHLSSYLQLPNYRRSFVRQGFDEGDLGGDGSDRLVDAIVAWGGPEEIRERVVRHLEAGADHVAIQAIPPREGEDPLATLADLASTLPLTG